MGKSHSCKRASCSITTQNGLKMIKLIVLLLVGLSSSTPMDMSALAVQRDSADRSIICGFTSWCLFDTDCQSTQWCDIVTQCCFPKTPTGGPCFFPGVGTSCANGACLERFPFGKIFLWPPSALTYMLGVCA